MLAPMAAPRFGGLPVEDDAPPVVRAVPALLAPSAWTVGCCVTGEDDETTPSPRLALDVKARSGDIASAERSAFHISPAVA